MATPSNVETQETPFPRMSDEGASHLHSPTERDALDAEWCALIRSQTSTHLFELPVWARPAFQTRETQTPLSAIISHHNEQIIGFLPLLARDRFLKAVPARVLRGFSNDFSPRCELIHHSEHRDLAARMTWETLRRDLNWRVVELLNVPEAGAANDVVVHAQRDGFRVVTIPAASTPIVRIGHDGDICYPNNSRVYRARLETKLRKVGRLGDIRLRSLTSTEKTLQSFLHLESTARHGRTFPTLAHTQGSSTLLRSISQWAEHGEALRIFSLELNGEPISMLFGIMLHSTFYTLRIACNTRLSMYSPGQLIVMLTLNELSTFGARSCELVGPILPWKMVWTSITRSQHSHYIFRSDPYGRTPLASMLGVALRGRALWPNLLT